MDEVQLNKFYKIITIIIIISNIVITIILAFPYFKCQCHIKCAHYILWSSVMKGILSYKPRQIRYWNLVKPSGLLAPIKQFNPCRHVKQMWNENEMITVIIWTRQGFLQHTVSSFVTGLYHFLPEVHFPEITFHSASVSSWSSSFIGSSYGHISSVFFLALYKWFFL